MVKHFSTREIIVVARKTTKIKIEKLRQGNRGTMAGFLTPVLSDQSIQSGVCPASYYAICRCRGSNELAILDPVLNLLCKSHSSGI